MTRQYTQMFHHGFGETEEEEARFWEFYNAVTTADRYKLAMCQMNQRGAGKGAHVNPSAAFADYVHPNDKRILATVTRSNPFQSATETLSNTSFMEGQLETMFDLVPHRDKSFADALTDYPDEKYHKLSWFLRNTEVLDHNPIDYNETLEEWTFVHANGKPMVDSIVSGTKLIETPRDLAWYVHADHPVLQWMSVVNDLLASNIDYYAGANLEACDEARFIIGGALDIHLLVAEVVRRTSAISFYTKWHTWFPRPAYLAYAEYGDLLPLVFNDYNPNHPSNNAMHHAASKAVYSAMVKVFDTEGLLPNGNSVGYELKLFDQNISYGRTIAGVHYPNDNEQYADIFTSIGENVWKEWVSVR